MTFCCTLACTTCCSCTSNFCNAAVAFCSTCFACACCCCFGVCIHNQKDGDKAVYGIGDLSSNVKEIPKGFENIRIPGNEWAVFKCTGPTVVSLKKIWERIYKEWLPGSEYELILGYYDFYVEKQYWQKVLDWGNDRKLLYHAEQDVLKMCVSMYETGHTPTDKQIKVVMKARERLIKEGMPIDF